MTKKLGLALAVAAIGISVPAQAQRMSEMGIFALNPVKDGNTVLTLTGKSTVTRQADVAFFSAGVTTTGATAEEALRANAVQMQAVLAAARKLGIAEKDIQTNQVSVTPVMDTEYNQYNFTDTAAATEEAADATAEAAAMAVAEIMVPKVPKIVGYRANNSVSITQRELNDFGRVIDMLVKAGANRVNGPTFMLEDSASTVDEARIGAIADAHKQAEFYAAAAGLKVVRIVMMGEGKTSGLSSSYDDAVYELAAGSVYDVYSETPVSTGELTITGSIGMLFELAPQ